jgi:IMP dehydrogenase
MKHCITNNKTMDVTVSNVINKQKTSLIKLDISNLTTLENTLKIAKELMLQNRIEKIPIVKGSILKGLITLKNIHHYEDNKSKACVDANGALCVGASIGIIGDYLQRLDKLIQAGTDLICVDVANGFNENVFNAIRIIRSKYPTIVLMVGNVCNWQGYAALSDFDVDCIRVGVGNGSICTTRLETGIGKGQFSAVAECFRYKISNNVLPNIICDGGSLGKTGNKVKALACGSSAIMLGRTLASTEESPGQIIFRNGRRFKYIRGMASTMANLSKQEKTDNVGQVSKKLKTNFTSEGVDGEQELTGSVSDLLDQINGGIKSGMSYLGCENIIQLHEKSAKNEIRFNLVTSIGMTETGIRVKTY